MDKILLRKAARRMIFTLLLMFAAPLIMASSFKNQDHPWFYPVLIIGILMGLAAIYTGFTGIKMLTHALLGKPGKGKSNNT